MNMMNNNYKTCVCMWIIIDCVIILYCYASTLMLLQYVCNKNELYYAVRNISIVNICIHSLIILHIISNYIHRKCLKIVCVILYVLGICYNIISFITFPDIDDMPLYNTCGDINSNGQYIAVNFLYSNVIISTMYYGIIICILLIVLYNNKVEEQQQQILSSSRSEINIEL